MQGIFYMLHGGGNGRLEEVEVKPTKDAFPTDLCYATLTATLHSILFVVSGCNKYRRLL